MATPNALKSYLKSHAANERAMAKVLRSFFRGQDDRIRELLGEHLDWMTLDARFNADDEAKLMLAKVEPLIIGMMATSAADVLKQADAHSSRQQKAFNLGKFKFSAAVANALTSTLDAIAKAIFWPNIQKHAAESVSDSIKGMIADGLSIPKMTKKLRTIMNGASKTRAETVARTEVGASMNAGAQTSYDYLADEGILEYKMWLAIGDDRTRPTHAALNGQKVPAKGNFVIGGVECPQPGSIALPPQERCNCRCTTIAVFGE
jgi:SPP1 gp7 family putative phage head morphogenesis protein